MSGLLCEARWKESSHVTSWVITCDIAAFADLVVGTCVRTKSGTLLRH